MLQTKKKIARQEKILSTLADLTYATLKQLQIIENLSSYTNAHRIISEMEKDKLIKSIRYDKKVYYLSNRGQERIGKEHTKLKHSWIVHTLMRNDLYIKLDMPRSWKKEVPVSFNGKKVIPDAMYKLNNEFVFIEIDNTQTMKTNFEKIKKYKELSNIMFNEYKHYPSLIWYSLSEIRKEKLGTACRSAGIKYKIY